MLKPYATRVGATYHMLRASLEAVRNSASTLRGLREPPTANAHPALRRAGRPFR
jgi:hypothetical protein